MPCTDRVAHGLHRLGAEVERSAASLVTGDPGTGVRVHVEISPRIAPEPSPAPACNRPGGIARPGLRADAVLREGTRSLYQWGPPPPASFLAPDDLAALMTGAHTS